MNNASRALAVSLPKPAAAHFFCFEGSCLRKQNGVWLLMSSEATLPRHLLKRKSGGLFLFHFASSFVRVSFRLWSISFNITCLHDSQITYTPSSGHKHVKQYRRTTLASKGNKPKEVRFELEASPSLSTYRWRHVSWDQSMHVRVNGVSGLT